jgi:hypothetical protein
VVDLKSTNKPRPDRARRRLPPTGRGGPSLKGQTHQSSRCCHGSCRCRSCWGGCRTCSRRCSCSGCSSTKGLNTAVTPASSSPASAGPACSVFTTGRHGILGGCGRNGVKGRAAARKIKMRMADPNIEMKAERSGIVGPPSSAVPAGRHGAIPPVAVKPTERVSHVERARCPISTYRSDPGRHPLRICITARANPCFPKAE